MLIAWPLCLLYVRVTHTRIHTLPPIHYYTFKLNTLQIHQNIGDATRPGLFFNGIHVGIHALAIR